MNKSILLGLLVLLFSCDDGDLQIETIDFNSVSIQTCETVTLDTKVFFKINNNETLILELESGKLKNEASDGDIESIVGTGSKLTYRIFSDNLTNSYFCSEVPLTEPPFIGESQAENGKVLITTVGVETDTLTFEHTLKLSDISFITETDARITNLNIDEFGTVTTVKTE